EAGGGGVGAGGERGLGIAGADDLDLLLEALCKRRAAPIGGFGHHVEPARRQTAADAVPPAAAIGISLVEERDPFPPDTYELVHQSRGLLAVGGPQVDHEAIVGWLSLGLCAGEGEEQQDIGVRV